MGSTTSATVKPASNGSSRTHGPRIRRDFRDVVDGAGRALHADLADESRHRLEKPRLSLRRNHQSLGRDDVEQSSMIRREAA